MKKLFLFGLAITALALGSCSSEDDINDTKIVVNPNVTDSKLDQKSGGVYFVSTLAGEYIFRLNLKNGDDAMTCEMFHDDKYSKLAAPETNWQVGDPLEDFQFSQGDVKLTLSLDADGEGEAQIKVGDKEYEAVIFKSTNKKPVKVYSGEDIIRYNIENGEELAEIYKFNFIMIVIDKSYYAGKIQVSGYGIPTYNYTPYLFQFIQKDATEITFLNPSMPDYVDEWSWERIATWDDDKISAYLYEEDEWGDADYSLNLHRRFKE
jgi:hypothetical protein